MASTIIRSETKRIAKEIIELIGLVRKNHERVKKALRETNKDLALKVIEKDKEIDSITNSIENDLEFMITKAPVDKDLRRVITYINTASEIERIGDYAKHIARFIIKSNGASQTSLNNIDKMHKLFRSMLRDFSKALMAEDTVAAKDTALKDNEVDDLYDEIRAKTIELLSVKSTNKKATEQVFQLAVLGSLERACDHIVNCCELISYIKTGKRTNFA